MECQIKDWNNQIIVTVELTWYSNVSKLQGHYQWPTGTFVQGHTGMLLVLLNYLSEKKLYRLDLNVLLVNSKN
jgi:hypothetical protein